MTTSVALGLVLAVLVAANIWVHVGPRRTHVVTGPLCAVALLGIARGAGLSWEELGLSRTSLLRGVAYAAAAAGATAVVFLGLTALPLTRRAFLDARYRMSMRAAVLTGLVTIPLATVVLEEIAFRSVLWGLIEHDHGTGAATIVSAGLFGVWHVLPALQLIGANPALSDPGRGSTRRKAALTVLGTVLFTALAGVVFAELRRRSGSVLAPVGLHWATNGLAVVAAARAWALSPSASDSAPAPDR